MSSTIKVHNFYPGELTPDATVAGCVDIFENVWPDPQKTILSVEKECSIIDSGAYWRKAETQGQGAYQNSRTNGIIDISHLADITNNKLMQNIHNQFYISLLAATLPYTKRYAFNEGFWHEGYSLLKYQESQYYDAHYDGSTSIGRAISALVYLNDDYEGGEIEFVNFKVKIKPKAGMMILFPSNYAYRHIAHPVTSGTKYALVTWIRDREF
jgi:predicted 2-oxoglutarate/Fe(II)-dependent dioxygenase YbiX